MKTNPYPALTIRLHLFALSLHLNTSVPVSDGRPAFRQWCVILTGRKVAIPGRALVSLLVQYNGTRLLHLRALIYPLPRL